MGPHFVGEGRRQVLLETELVPEVLAGSRHDLETQAELIGIGFFGAQLDELGEGGLGDLDDRFAGGRLVSRQAGKRAALRHALTLSRRAARDAGILGR